MLLLLRTCLIACCKNNRFYRKATPPIIHMVFDYPLSWNDDFVALKKGECLGQRQSDNIGVGTGNLGNQESSQSLDTVSTGFIKWLVCFDISGYYLIGEFRKGYIGFDGKLLSDLFLFTTQADTCQNTVGRS